MSMEVSARERGLVRVFAVDLPDTEIEAFGAPGPEGWPLKEALGATALDPDRVEVFPARNLEGVGLSAYLLDGLGVDPDELRGLAERLDAETQGIAVVTSAALGDMDQRLTPRAPLRHLGTFREADAPVRFDPLPAGGAEGAVTGPADAPPAPPPRLPRWMVVAGLVFAVLVLWIVLRAGGGNV